MNQACKKCGKIPEALPVISWGGAGPLCVACFSSQYPGKAENIWRLLQDGRRRPQTLRHIVESFQLVAPDTTNCFCPRHEKVEYDYHEAGGKSEIREVSTIESLKNVEFVCFFQGQQMCLACLQRKHPDIFENLSDFLSKRVAVGVGKK